jgi:Polysaccharide pyruvyl transferase
VKTLVAGWFSFEGMGATAGDLLARDLACEWLREAGRSVEVAHAPPFSGGVDWRSVDPAEYQEVLFVCGPFGNGPPLDGFLKRFRAARLIGLDVSLLEPLEAWDPFDLLWERDSSRTSRPDISFGAPSSEVPVIGVVLVHPQREYAGGMHDAVDAAIGRLLEAREMAVVEIDTRLDENSTGLGTPGEVEALIARADVVVTTRLHGLVLALRNAVPALVIDPIAGGAKVHRQAEALGWPVAFNADEISDAVLEAALDRCLSEEMRGEAARCGDRARERVAAVHAELVATLREADQVG